MQALLMLVDPLIKLAWHDSSYAPDEFGCEIMIDTRKFLLLVHCKLQEVMLEKFVIEDASSWELGKLAWSKNRVFKTISENH